MEMLLETRLWREAAVASSVAAFMDRIGKALLADLRLEVIGVRSLEAESRRLETIAWIRRGRIGVLRPASSDTDLLETAASRLRQWVDAGEGELASRDDASAVARDLVRGLGTLDEGHWSIVPVALPGAASGALIAQSLASGTHDRRMLAAVAEAVAAVAARDHAQLELTRVRDVAEAEKAAALARLQVRDIAVAVIGADTGLRDVMRQVEQVAPTSAPVLIFGETGSGKEVVARAIHERSDRAHGPILRVNCGAISPELIDSELFGHERGSFTGAIAQRSGWFERADGGTLFLDEIAELPLAAQVRLLRVVQDGVFERVGGVRSLRVDVRVIAATHRDLGAMSERGAFRQDLWYRINVFTIRLPPLRERQNDIPALAAYFAEREARRVGAPARELSRDELALLRAYDWPGNVRELGAVMERAAILGEGGRLDIPRALGASVVDGSAFPTLNLTIQRHIERALKHCRGRIDGPRGAARLLGLNPNTLRSKIAKFDIRIAAFRPDLD